MNILELLNNEKPVSAAHFFKGQEGAATAIQILAGNQLPSHITKIPAMLLCISGMAVFEDENGVEINLATGEFVLIKPDVKHWINAKEDSLFLLVK